VIAESKVSKVLRVRSGLLPPFPVLKEVKVFREIPEIWFP
jgi:hypothetical protein